MVVCEEETTTIMNHPEKVKKKHIFQHVIKRNLASTPGRSCILKDRPEAPGKAGVVSSSQLKAKHHDVTKQDPTQ
jgi:hypothetical protein